QSQSCQRAQQHVVAKERADAQKLPAEARAPPAVTLFVFLEFGFNRIIFKFPFWLAWGGLAFCWTLIIFMLMLQWTPFGKAAQRV
ncbi:hypothetical protein, partial [Klebsiella pneumoniae]|uniref:hypothetical protein n=1 Tax=Klebsiella pneumoniae TaxID=573 RepID=UPI002731B999